MNGTPNEAEPAYHLFLETDDVHREYEQLRQRGVEFSEPPEERPYGIDSAFRDPSGNSIRLAQPKALANSRA